MREGSEAVDLLEDSQVALCMLDGLKATEVLVVLVEAADDEFDAVVGGGDQGGADAIEELRPVAFQEVEDGSGLGCSLDIAVAQSQHGGVAFMGQMGYFGVKDGIDLLFEDGSLRPVFGIVAAVDILDVALYILQSMEDTFVMDGLGEELGDKRTIVLAQIGDDDVGMIALGAQS